MKKIFGLLMAVLFVGSAGAATTSTRGNAQLAQAYQQNQRNTYYMVTQPDVDSACRDKIFQCLSDYCGDVSVVPGVHDGRCAYATESELYNVALLCLQKDTTALMPNYAVGVKGASGGMNTAGRLCPSYVQQELMTFLSMSNMATQLTKAHSTVCLQRRQELEAAMSCHQIALSYGNETQNRLTTELSSFCGAGAPGGSAEMVSSFANAGNVGANIWGWAEKIVSLDLSNKGDGWQSAVDSVLANYVNRMNLACGDNFQMNLPARADTGGTGTTNLQVAASMAVGMAFPKDTTEPAEMPLQTLWMDVQSMSAIYDYATAKQVVQAGLTNSPMTQNTFLSSAQMDSMQTAYKLGTKVFVIRDTARCFTVPVAALSTSEQSVLGQQFASCVNK